MKIVTTLKILIFSQLLIATPLMAEADIPGSERGVNDQFTGLECLKGTGEYVVNFTAYSPDVVWENDRGVHKKGTYRKLCQELPSVGKFYFSLDLNDALQEKAVGFRIVGAEKDNQETLLEIPPKAYSGGILNTEANFTVPGKYKVIIEIAEEANGDKKTIKIPLSVGPSTHSFILEILIPLLLIGGIGFWMYQRDRRKKAEAEKQRFG